MSYTKAIDVSEYQGNIDWNSVKDSGVEIAIIKMSGGDAGLYYDSKATQNYYQAKAAGVAVGMYHFAGAGDATQEASYFVQACSPLEQDDVLVLDWEVSHPNPVDWCTTFVNKVHELTGVWPLIYFNGATWKSWNWTPVTSNCGVWVAWWDTDPEDTLPVPGVYVMHQYTSDGSVPGIAGRVDLDAWFGTVAQFKKYGYQTTSSNPSPEPTPPTTPEPKPEEPVPAPLPEPTPTPLPEPEPTPDPAPTPDPVPVPPTQAKWFAIYLRAAKTFVQVLVAALLANISHLTTLSAIKTIALASLAAAASAAWNVLQTPPESKSTP